MVRRILEPLMFWKKNQDSERKRLIDSLGFKKGDVLFTVPAEKGGTLKNESLVLVLYGFMQGLALKLREHDIRLLVGGIRESMFKPGNIYVIIVVEVYTRCRNGVKVGSHAVRVELSKRFDRDMYVFTVEYIEFVYGYDTPLNIYPRYSFVYVDRVYLDVVRRMLHGENEGDAE